MHTPTNTNTPISSDMNVEDDETARLRQELAVAQQHLEEITKAHAAFISAFSHDIKNPLTTIMGRVELLKRLAKRTAVTPADIARHIEPLDGAVSRLEYLIQNFSTSSGSPSTSDDVKDNAA